jgi:hypothetical protein
MFQNWKKSRGMILPSAGWRGGNGGEAVKILRYNCSERSDFCHHLHRNQASCVSCKCNFIIIEISHMTSDSEWQVLFRTEVITPI